MKIIAIDLAENAGLAFCDYETPHKIYCTYLIGSPQDQLQDLESHVDLNEQNIILIEDFVYFGLNAKTSKSLLMRLGYFVYTLEAMNQTVILIKPNEARRWLKEITLPDDLDGKKPKEQIYKLLKPLIKSDTVKITNDITDAIALIITQQNLSISSLEMEMLNEETN